MTPASRPRSGIARWPWRSQVDDLRRRLFVGRRQQDVRRFQVAMNDRLLMRVLHALADDEEEIEGRFRMTELEAVWYGPARPRDLYPLKAQGRIRGMGDRKSVV